MPPATPGDLILVTGSNGFIASHIVNELLLKGFNVRGTVRSLEKNEWPQKLFDESFGKGRYECVVVPDFGAEGAYDVAVKGTQGIIHVASDTTFDADPNKVITPVLAGMKNILTAAAREPDMKRFVLTSSASAAAWPKPGVETTVEVDSWNDEAVKAAWAPPPYTEDRIWNVYGASKTLGEQEMWRFAREEEPHFDVNSVLPFANFGPLLHESHRKSTTPSWITYTYGVREMPPFFSAVFPQHYVNVVDDARLHVAALVDPEISKERIFAYANPWSFNRQFAIARKLRPDVQFPDDTEDTREDISTIVGKQRANDILIKHYGAGFQSLEDTLKQQFECLEK